MTKKNSLINKAGDRSRLKSLVMYFLIVAISVFSMETLINAATRVSTGKLIAAATHKPMPRYDVADKRSGAQGQVEVEVTVGEDGLVKSARSISGNTMLRDPAKEAAMQWRFDSKKLSDSAGEVVGVLVFNFNPNT
jgi:TonB family protein